MIFVRAKEMGIIKDLLVSRRLENPNEIVDAVIQLFYDKTIHPSDQALLNLAFDKELTQNALNEFLQKFDIECFGSDKALLLSYVMKMHPQLKFDAYTGPRLEGLLRYFRFKNLELISHYTKIGKALNAAGIKPMILKGGAMKYLRPELSRAMGDIDILLQTQKEYKHALKIVKELGYDYEDEGHSVDLHLPGSDAGIVDIHQYIELGIHYNHQFLQRLFKRASLKTIWGVETWLPCTEDMLFIGITNLVKNLNASTSIQGILYTLFDFEFLKKFKPNFNWQMVLDNIRATHSEQHMYTAMKFANKIVPNILPQLLTEDKHFEKYIHNICNENIFYAFYVYDVRTECKKLRLKNALKSWHDFKHYFQVEGQHFFTKRIMKSQFLINFFLKLVH